jgi:hypothetical protein
LHSLERQANNGPLSIQAFAAEQGGLHVADAMQKNLDRWIAAGILDRTTAGRIRTFEESRGSGDRLRWPVLLALLGGLLLDAGILLFVAAHWEELTPGSRFALVLLMVAAFPVGGALTSEKFPALSTTFHAVGTPAGTVFLEVTIPPKEPPRPIRFGTKVGNEIVPLATE